MWQRDKITLKFEVLFSHLKLSCKLISYPHLPIWIFGRGKPMWSLLTISLQNPTKMLTVTNIKSLYITFKDKTSFITHQLYLKWLSLLEIIWSSSWSMAININPLASVEIILKEMVLYSYSIWPFPVSVCRRWHAVGTAL